MRIDYLSNSTIPSRAANSVQVMKMCNAFAIASHSVQLFAKRGEKIDDIHLHYGTEGGFRLSLCRGLLGRRFSNLSTAWAAIWRVLSRGRPDLFYGRHAYSLAAASCFRRPMILEVHDLPHSWAQRLAQRWVLRSKLLVRIVFISHALRDAYGDMFPWISPDRMLVAADGAAPVDMDSIEPAFPRNERVRIGYIGSLHPGKGMEVIVKLAQRMPDIVFHVVGGSTNEHANWVRQANCGNLSFQAAVPHSEVPGYLKSFDIVLAPYQRQVAVHGGSGDVARWMSPLKLFEYMAAGCAIVSSDLPVLAEFMKDGWNSRLVPPSDIDAWESTLRELANDPMAGRNLGENARADFLAKYTWKQRAANVLGDLENCVSL